MKKRISKVIGLTWLITAIANLLEEAESGNNSGSLTEPQFWPCQER